MGSRFLACEGRNPENRDRFIGWGVNDELDVRMATIAGLLRERRSPLICGEASPPRSSRNPRRTVNVYRASQFPRSLENPYTATCDLRFRGISTNGSARPGRCATSSARQWISEGRKRAIPLMRAKTGAQAFAPLTRRSNRMIEAYLAKVPVASTDGRCPHPPRGGVHEDSFPRTSVTSESLFSRPTPASFLTSGAPARSRRLQAQSMIRPSPTR